MGPGLKPSPDRLPPAPLKMVSMEERGGRVMVGREGRRVRPVGLEGRDDEGNGEGVEGGSGGAGCWL